MKKIILSLILVFIFLAGCEKQQSAKSVIIDDVEMIKIPGGKFVMGCDTARVDACPAHKVYIDEFYIDRYEVTNAQYKKFIDATGYPAPYLDPKEYPWAEPFNWKENNFPDGTANLPVVLVSWDDAMAYAQWRGCRLPTEAEWEKAARGTKGLIYSWGNEWDSLKVNYQFSDWRRLIPADSSIGDVSGYGVFHINGNVREWCLDWYKIDAYKDSPGKCPQGPGIGSRKVVRGGSWKTFDKARMTNFFRNSEFPSTKTIDLGFRCVKEVKNQSQK
jgi:formylglycine-generating enzyme required for sulfatase activity